MPFGDDSLEVHLSDGLRDSDDGLQLSDRDGDSGCFLVESLLL